MHRVTRISSAAFGMLLLAGLAYYQGNPDPTAGQSGALVGTAVVKTPEKPDIDCENTAALSEKERRYCVASNPTNKD